MREVHVSAITDTIKKLRMEANWNLGGEMLRAFGRALTTELPVAVTIECHAHRHKEATL